MLHPWLIFQNPKIRNFGQKSKFWSKIEILVKNQNLVKNRNFGQKIEILDKNRNFGQKSCTKKRHFGQQTNILVSSQTFGKNRNIGHTFEVLVEHRKFGQKSTSNTLYISFFVKAYYAKSLNIYIILPKLSKIIKYFLQKSCTN